MSGHEKFYVPHDDLQELKTAIESLDTNITSLSTKIDTLTSAVQALYQYYIAPASETFRKDSGTSTAETQNLTLANAVLSATQDVFIKSITIGIYAGPDSPVLAFDSEVTCIVATSGTSIIYEPTMGDEYNMSLAEYAVWQLHRTWRINNTRIPAGTNVKTMAYISKMAVGTLVYVWINYAFAGS